MSEPHTSPRTITAVGAQFPAVHRGLSADILAGAGLDLNVRTVCTAFVMAGRGVVTDFVEVPEDTVRAQFEHTDRFGPAAGMKIGVLASHGATAVVLDAAERFGGPVVLDLQLSGPEGETLLSRRGIDIMTSRLHVPDVVLLNRTDAELISGGEITSLDDVQVAVQRIVHRGARAVVIKAGHLPARHFESSAGGDGADEPFAADVLYDGKEFALFEAPLLPPPDLGGPASAHAMALLSALIDGHPLESAVQSAKRYVTEAMRTPIQFGSESSLAYFWKGPHPPT